MKEFDNYEDYGAETNSCFWFDVENRGLHAKSVIEAVKMMFERGWKITIPDADLVKAAVEVPDREC